MTPPTARDIIAATNGKRLSVTTLASDIAAHIEAADSAIGAWHFFDPARLTAEANRLDNTPHHGPLHGLPVAIKDVIDTADMPTAYGSALYEGNQPRSDASCVALLRDAGALIVGKTVSTEFAFKAPGKTTHPFDHTRTPGGSSSGSAAAVAAGMVPVALGTQTSGSTIRPAAFCGIVGYKPSFGLIDRTGIKVLADSLDTLGLFARTVDDIALVAAVLSGRPALAHIAAATAPRLAVFRSPCWHLADADAQHSFEQSLLALARAGAVLQEIEDPGDFTALLSAHETVMNWEVPRALAFERLAGAHALQPTTREGIAPVPGLTADTYDAARARADTETHLWAQALEGFDALVTLPARGEAPIGLASTGDPIFNRAWTQLRLPCVTVPAGTGASGLPLGLQLVGAPLADGQLLAAAMMAEEALKEGKNVLF
jgi:amidase